MAKRHYSSGDYAGKSGRDSEERRDAGMISEDHSAVANLPQAAVMKPWPKSGYPATSDYEDTIKGVNEQISADDSEAKRRKGGFKY